MLRSPAVSGGLQLGDVELDLVVHAMDSSLVAMVTVESGGTANGWANKTGSAKRTTLPTTSSPGEAKRGARGNWAIVVR